MNKIIEVVDNLNEKLWGINGDKNLNHCFSYTKAGYIEGISLNLNFETYSINISLWNDNDDDRKFIEKKNDYEDLEKHLIQKYKNVLKDMSKITKYLIK
jgi:hypothetical protein